MNPILQAYVAAGLTTSEQILEYAKLRGSASYLQALSAINESAGSVIRLLGFNKDVAEEINRLFGPFDYPAARLMLSVGNGKYSDELKNGFEDLDLMKSILEEIVGDVIDAIGANSTNDEYIVTADLKSFLQRNQSILPNLNTTPPGPACIEIARQATLLKKKSIKQLRVLVPLKDNWNWVDLGCSADGAEGVEMQNCGHDFAGNLVSLRDEFNNPHITMTYRESDNTVYQIKGKQNTYPARKYWWAIEKFFQKTGAKLEDRWLSTQAQDHEDAKDLIDVIRMQTLLHPDYGKTKSESLFREDVRQNSTAMVIVPGDPPGKNVTDMIRRLVADRTKLIVVAQSSSLGPGDFERLLRASMPDVEKKLRIMDDGNSVADAVSSAERNRHYRPSQALEVFCSKEQADAFTQEIRAGSLKFDPTVIAVSPMEIPTDDVVAITSAISGEDLQAMHRVLDPHIFSNQGSLQIYKNLLKGQKTESLIRESSGLLRVYHGTNRRIDTPQDPIAVKAMMSGMDYGPGMYFTTSPRDAKEYGSNLYQADVDLKNPLVISSEMSPEMDKFRKSFDIGEEEMEFTDEGVWHCIMGFVISLIDAGLTSKKKVIDTIRKLGHDGIIVPAAVVRESKHGSSVTGDYVIVFDPSQITNWGEAVAAAMLSRKKKSIDEQDASGQDNFLNQVKLGTINWDFREKAADQSPAEGGFKAWSKRIKINSQGNDRPRFVCAVAILTTAGFSKLTGRGSTNAQGWIVDTEIYQHGVGKRKWFYHNEKRLPTPEAAQAYADRIKSFIDSKTLSELLGTPKSGKISMSKFEQIQRFGTLHEFLSDIAPTRELGISKLDDILKKRMGDSFDELEYLGTGRNGSAYRTIEGPVLKITTDREEAKSANMLRGKKCEYIYHVHSVTKIAEGVWLILQEGDLEKLPQEYCEEFDTAVEILETIGAGEALRTGDVDSILEIMIKSEHIDLCDLVTEVMEKFGISGMLAEISKLGLSADFHSGNIKLRNGRPVLTDLGTPGDDNNIDKKVNKTGSRRVIEFTGMQSAGSAGQMRGSNSSAWAGGRMVLSKPEQHVPEDENATERDNALDQDIVGGGLDWGQSRNRGSF